MSSTPSLFVYLVRDSVRRWGGRGSVPTARLVVAAGLSSAAVLVLASFALGISALEARVAQFGLDSLVVRTPLRRALDPAPIFSELSEHGRVLTLTLPYANVGLETGRQVPLALATDDSLIELARLGMRVNELPLLVTSALPPGMPVRASLGPWSLEAKTTAPADALRPLGLNDLLIARAGDFPMQSMLPGTAVTLFIRAAAAPTLDRISSALGLMFANNPPVRAGAPSVESALPLLREMAALQTTWRGYAALLATILATIVAVVFGSGAILEFEATAYTTALLRSFGVASVRIWIQRYVEAAILANAGFGLGLLVAIVTARAALPQLEPHLVANAVILPVLAGLNLGAIVAALPVALALRRPVGIVLQ
ncbi:MAG: hypothetical protein JWM35_2032 [Verrucomicrobia bacterium]|nr:hypothetical protein [Verrucomicrobiota bacterium]